MKVNLQTASQRLLSQNNILILAHRRPDGDTLGSAFGLLFALESLGKTARVECADPFPDTYDYFIGEDYTPAAFVPEFIVAVDTATQELLGSLEPVYGDKVDLCIDHHGSNNFFAKETLLDASAPAATQLVFQLLQQMEIRFTQRMADALFTGLVTDTGCFRYPSTTSETHRTAAALIDYGARHGMINRLLFETKSQGVIAVEQQVLNTLEYHFDGLCASIFLKDGLKERYDVTDDDLSGLAALPRTIEGVLLGITIREQGESQYRISARSHNPVDSSAVCQTFGGGGHKNAAGCTITGTLEQVKEKLLSAVKQELEQKNLWTESC